MNGTTDASPLVSAAGEASALGTVLSDLETRSDQLASALARAFAQGVSGARSLDEVLRGLALKLSSIALDAGLKPLENLLSASLGNLFSGTAAPGAANPGTSRFANGGVVSAPTFFTDAGGGSGLMGEAGAEAILPLRRGADGALGVALSEGPSAGPRIVFNIQTPDAESFRRSEAQLTAMLARAARRGGRHL